MSENAAQKANCKDGPQCNLTLLKSVSFTKGQRAYSVVKRVMDATFSGILLAVLSPIFGLTALAVKLSSRGPAIFCQQRVGQYGNLIKVYKFRTMYVDAPNVATADLNCPERFITPIGRFLRDTSLDELPQLLNVLKGDMSFIGPRPLIPLEKEIHIRRMEKGIYYLRPGMTGLAQVNGRDLVSPELKVEYDAEYLKEFGPKMDWKIFTHTIGKVLKHDGIVEGNMQSEENISESKTEEIPSDKKQQNYRQAYKIKIN